MKNYNILQLFTVFLMSHDKLEPQIAWHSYTWQLKSSPAVPDIAYTAFQCPCLLQAVSSIKESNSLAHINREIKDNEKRKYARTRNSIFIQLLNMLIPKNWRKRTSFLELKHKWFFYFIFLLFVNMSITSFSTEKSHKGSIFGLSSQAEVTKNIFFEV